MFKKTLRRLTLLNSLVFLLIFIVFGVLLYGYVAHQLFDDIDQAMEHKVTAFRISHTRLGNGFPLAFFEPRILILLQDTEQNLTNLYPFQIQGIAEITAALEKDQAPKWQTRRIEGHVYRILSVPYEYSDNIVLREGIAHSAPIQQVIAISIVDSEVAILRRFMFIILASQCIGMMLIIPSGYYLARRALVPIQTSWEKQQQFVADASHELRTPLAVIKSNAELLLRHPEHTVEEETIRITNVVRETIRMNKLVSTLFTLARADANQLELQVALLSLNDIVIHVAEQFQPLAEMKNIVLQVDIQDEIELVADKERLHQLFVILLDNAIKYTAPQGNINLVCCKQSNMAFIKVIDTGCGIGPQDLPRVFDRFFRGDKVRSREAGGAGLGLAIAYWIVEKHGGQIWATSEVGIGTQFHINLPIERT